MSKTLTISESPTDEVSLPTAAAIIGMPRSSAYLEVIRGRLRARLVAGRYVVTRADAISYRNSRPVRERAGEAVTT